MNPKRTNPKKSMLRHIMIKLLNTKDKENVLEQPERNNTSGITEHELD